MPSIQINHQMCDQTGTCVLVCPEDVFVQEDGWTKIIDRDACIECWLCVENCVSGALELD